MSKDKTEAPLPAQEPESCSIAPADLPPLQVKPGETLNTYRVVQCDAHTLEMREGYLRWLFWGLLGLVLMIIGIYIIIAAGWQGSSGVNPIIEICLLGGGAGVYGMVTHIGKTYRFEEAARTIQTSRGPFRRRSFPVQATNSVQIVTTKIMKELFRVQMAVGQDKPLVILEEMLTSGKGAEGAARFAIHLSRMFNMPLELIGVPKEGSEALNAILDALKSAE